MTPETGFEAVGFKKNEEKVHVEFQTFIDFVQSGLKSSVYDTFDFSQAKRLKSSHLQGDLTVTPKVHTVTHIHSLITKSFNI